MGSVARAYPRRGEEGRRRSERRPAGEARREESEEGGERGSEEPTLTAKFPFLSGRASARDPVSKHVTWAKILTSTCQNRQ
jgi:hypothetical protein